MSVLARWRSADGRLWLVVCALGDGRGLLVAVGPGLRLRVRPLALDDARATTLLAGTTRERDRLAATLLT